MVKTEVVQNKKSNSWLILILLIALIFLLWKAVPLLKHKAKSSPQSTKSTQSTQSSQSFCKRTQPYPNPPELNSAAELVVDRIGEKLGAQQMAERLKNWQNCLNMQYKSLPDGVEGAFIFDENSSVDNLKVFVDDDYKNYPETLRALLLSHELRHVLQFLEFKATGVRVDCVRSEVEAFETQFLFGSSLHHDEREALATSARANLRSEEYRPVLELFVIHKTVENKCGQEIGGVCYRQELDSLLTKMVTSNPAYQKQCNL